jgi:aldehyde reductase
LGGAAWHGFAYHAQDRARARENLNISALPEDALDEINRIQTRQRFNEVVKTGSPGFIPQGG